MSDNVIAFLCNMCERKTTKMSFTINVVKRFSHKSPESRDRIKVIAQINWAQIRARPPVQCFDIWFRDGGGNKSGFSPKPKSELDCLVIHGAGILLWAVLEARHSWHVIYWRLFMRPKLTRSRLWSNNTSKSGGKLWALNIVELRTNLKCVNK